jgi:hypothetical protein
VVLCGVIRVLADCSVTATGAVMVTSEAARGSIEVLLYLHSLNTAL